MESQSLIEKIKSKVNIRYIFSYVTEKRKYQMVKYRKKLQNILNLSFSDYKEKCFELFQDIDFLDLLTTKDDTKRFSLAYKYDKEIKNNKLDKKKHGKLIDEYVENFFIKIYDNYKSKEKIDKTILDTNLIIDIFSPFYETLMKKDIFEKLFVLLIPFPLICEKKLMQEYYDATDLLIEINPNFSSFYFEVSELDNKIELDDFKDFCNYFYIIKKLILEFTKNSYLFKFPHEIFSYSNIKNNLIYLELKFHDTFHLSEKY